MANPRTMLQKRKIGRGVRSRSKCARRITHRIIIFRLCKLANKVSDYGEDVINNITEISLFSLYSLIIILCNNVDTAKQCSKILIRFLPRRSIVCDYNRPLENYRRFGDFGVYKVF
jgi:hypothetical protein